MTDPQDVLRQATEWFVRFDSADFTEEDSKQFQAWRQQSPAHDAAFERVRRTWVAPDFADVLVPPAERITTSPSRRLHKGTPRWISAGIAASIVMASLWFFGSPLLIALRADVHTSIGEQRTIQLPDNSSVVLNTNTAVTSHVDGTERRVELLQGEAFFQIQSNPDRPFTVEHAGHQVRVLGTEFIVRERQNTTTVTVVKGLVSVSQSPSSSSIQLTPGQEVTISAGGSGPIRVVTAADSMAWTRRRLVVSDTPLSDVIAEIQRYHAGYILTWGTNISSIRVTGIYDLSDTTETLTVLADTLPIQMDRLTDRFIIFR